MKKIMGKRILSLFLAAIMVIGALPWNSMTVNAADGEWEENTAVEETVTDGNVAEEPLAETQGYVWKQEAPGVILPGTEYIIVANGQDIDAEVLTSDGGKLRVNVDGSFIQNFDVETNKNAVWESVAGINDGYILNNDNNYVLGGTYDAQAGGSTVGLIRRELNLKEQNGTTVLFYRNETS